MMGADIGYVALGNGKYKIIAKIYRDCRGITLNGPTFQVFAGLNGGNTCGTNTLSLTRTGIRDITPVCISSNKPCNPQNTGYTGEGVEEHTYETTVDFFKAPLMNYVNTANCCEVTFAVGQCCRNGAITTGPANNDFWATCMINICNLTKTKAPAGSVEKTNTTPFRGYPPIFFVCCNKPFYWSDLGMDSIDRDSTVQVLVPGIASLPNTSVNYSSPFSYKFPLTPFCIPAGSVSCTPNPNLQPPRGFYFNNGNFVFTPSNCSEVFVLSTETQEYRTDTTTGKKIMVGKSRTDYQFIVKSNCNGNAPPTIDAPVAVDMCSTKDSVFYITIHDSSLRYGQTGKDTINTKILSDIRGINVQMVEYAFYRHKYKITIPRSAVNSLNGKRYVTAYAEDKACPINAVSTKSIEINIAPKVTPVYKDSLPTGIHCQTAYIKTYKYVKENPKNTSYFSKAVVTVYPVSGGMPLLKDSTTGNSVITFNNGGKYVVKRIFYSASVCKPIETFDTLNIPDRAKLSIQTQQENCAVLKYLLIDSNSRSRKSVNAFLHRKVNTLEKLIRQDTGVGTFTHQVTYSESGNYRVSFHMQLANGCLDTQTTSLIKINRPHWDEYYTGKAKIYIKNDSLWPENFALNKKGIVKWYFNDTFLTIAKSVKPHKNGVFSYTYEDDTCISSGNFSQQLYYWNNKKQGFVRDFPITISPNPGNGNFIVKFDEMLLPSACIISIYNTVGSEIKFARKDQGAEADIRMEKCAIGVYYLKVTSGNFNYTQPFMVNSAN
ncbi:MAG: T9SS type A sorting domain-containing protein [Sphingomonadales bacterium]